jgi:hypothetical protein
MDKVNNILSNMVKYIVEDESESSFASLNLNPSVRWAKFVLTDDKPNSNGMRVPISEFSNLIKTGIFMPIKVAVGNIAEGHEGSIPIGVITHLKKAKNRIEGLAALWQKERPEDVDMLKEKYENGEPLDLSWEIEHSSSVEDEDGIINLEGTRLRAVTVVGIPAYGGRTAITAFASKDKQEDSTLDELTKLKDELASTNQEKQNLGIKVKELEDQVKTLTEQVATASQDKEELEQLKEYKREIEELKARVEKIEKIKTKFSESGVKKSSEYFDENIDRFLGMDEDTLDFMIQELVAFSGDSDDDEDDESNESKSSRAPRIIDTDSKIDVKAMLQYLKEQNK